MAATNNNSREIYFKIDEAEWTVNESWQYPSEINLAPGESMVLKMEERPTTGFRLELSQGTDGGDFNIVSEGSYQEEEDNDPMKVGCGQTCIYRIEAGSASSGSFTASYK